MRRILVIDPFKPGRAEVELVKRRRRLVQTIKVAHQAVDTGVFGLVEQMPVKVAVVIPFPRLRKLAAHEQQFFARVAPHEAQVGAQVGELLPGIARHFAQQRAFAMHHLVVRDRQHEVFAEGIVQAEGQLALVVLAMHRVARHVEQGVVHPAHVPLEIKAQAAA